MDIKKSKFSLYLGMIFKNFTNFFGEIAKATKGKQLAVLWTIAIFFGFIVFFKYYFVAFSNKYSLGVDLSNISSNEHIFFSVKKNYISYDQLQRGQYIMFHTDKMEPHISRNVSIIKKVIGKQGDHVQVVGMDVLVNGKKYGQIHAEALVKLHKTEAEIQQDYIIPQNALFVMGSYERSYDSRYWGYLPIKQNVKINLATPILF
ncbi:signal peptidase I [Acinetobacter sp. P1(2025)]|uniref:signal peptidase I n=1 Tax=Acinetobacter sp. P1(2025) TaxID=3446120 RepID=UPI003F531798